MPYIDSVGATDPIFGLIKGAGLYGLLPSSHGGLSIIRMQCIEPSPTFNLLNRLTRICAPFRHVYDLTVCKGCPNERRRRAHQCAIALLGNSERLLRALALRDFLCNHVDAHDPAVGALLRVPMGEPATFRI